MRAAPILALTLAACAPSGAGPVPTGFALGLQPAAEEGADSAAPDSADTAAPDTADTACCADSDPVEAPSRRPNLLFVIVDDFGLDKASFDPGAPCYEVGEPDEDPRMPNLARLCAEGVRFDAAWGAPTCSPLRASALTGLTAHRHGLGAPLYGDAALSEDARTLPQVLAAAGSDYAMANIGKWHLSRGAGDPNARGWPHFAGLIAGTLPDYWRWERTEDGVTAQVQDYATTRNVDDALAWLGGVEPGAPWFLWLAFNAPHAPFHLPPSELHDRDDLPAPDGANPPADWRPYYAAMVEAVDAELGRLLAELEARGEAEHTVIVFLGDNGTPPDLADPPFQREAVKGTLFEGGVRVPLIVAGPGVKGGRAVAHPVAAYDLFPTFLELAGEDPAVVAPGIDGVSLVPLLRDPDAPAPRDHALVEQFGGPAYLADDRGRALRDARHKLICLETAQRPMLFDLIDDPYEMVDLLEGSPSLEDRDTALRLAGTLEGWVGASVCPPVPE